MENDIEIEQLEKINQQKEEKLRRMKNNIEKLQLNMNKKGKSNQSNLHNNPPSREPVTIYNHYEKEYASPSPVNTDKQFVFNSTLFKNINNQSQPIMQNGSAVSNFSSVSNINNLLNGRFHQDRNPAEAKPYQKPKIQNNFLSDIDRLLEKSKNSKKMPIKAFQKFLDIKETKESKVFSEIQELQSSRYSDKKKEQIPSKTKIQQYRKLIEKLDPIPQHKPYKVEDARPNKDANHERYYSSDLSEQSMQIKQKTGFAHKKSQPSNLTNKSEYAQSYIKYPPLPSARTTAQNPVERHKALIKESFQQRKKLQTEVINQNLDKTQIDLELSDQQSEQQKKEKQLKIEDLLNERQSLTEQLEQIQKELEQLQNSL